MTVWEHVVLGLTGVLTSGISGVLGMAGGVTLLGVMAAVLPVADVVPLHGAVQILSNSTRTVVFARHVLWRIFAVYALPVAAGTALATWAWSGAEIDWLKPAVGLLILAFLVWRRRAPKLRNLALWLYAPLGLAAGFVGMFVGATGPFTAAFFLRDDAKQEQIVATKAVSQAWLHLLKIPAFLALGFDFRPYLVFLAVMACAAVLGTLLGRYVLDRIPRRWFIRIFELVLAAIALELIVTGVLAWA